jgi:hypothetical protein
MKGVQPKLQPTWRTAIVGDFDPAVVAMSIESADNRTVPKPLDDSGLVSDVQTGVVTEQDAAGRPPPLFFAFDGSASALPIAIASGCAFLPATKRFQLLKCLFLSLLSLQLEFNGARSTQV